MGKSSKLSPVPTVISVWRPSSTTAEKASETGEPRAAHDERVPRLHHLHRDRVRRWRMGRTSTWLGNRGTADPGRRSASRSWSAIISDARSKAQDVPVKRTKSITSRPCPLVAHGGIMTTSAPHARDVTRCETRSGRSLRRVCGEDGKKMKKKKMTEKIRANFSREIRFHPDEESMFLLTERSEPVRDGRVEL